jgi:hypothetical protein
MFRKIILCWVGVYAYVIFAFIQMDWLIKKKIVYTIENELTFVDPVSPGQRHLSEYEYTEMFHTTNGVTNARDCDIATTHACQLHCKLANASNINNNSNHHAHDVSTKCNLYKLVENCEQFKKVYGYNRFPVTNEERNFPLAFGLKMHHLPEQGEIILRSIYRSHNVYCVHVDSKADYKTFNVIYSIGRCFDNVVIVKDREYMVYSSYAHVMSDIKCMRALLSSNLPWKYYINLSGEEFPLKTNLEMVAILQFFQGMNDIETYDHPRDQNWKIKNRFIKYSNSMAQDVKKPKFRYTMKFSKGNSFGLFSRNFVEFVFHDNVSKDILAWLNDTYSPEENIWATLVTLPWAPGGYPVEVRHIVSSYVSRAMIFTGERPQCHGKFVRGYCQFTCGDLPWLKSRPEFFASKLESQKSMETLNCLFDWYKTKTYNPELININWEFFNRLPHIKYHRKNNLMMGSNLKVEEIKKKWLSKHTRKV